MHESTTNSRRPASQMFCVPGSILERDQATELEYAIMEEAVRKDVHPYEEAQAYQRLLYMPGYDFATLVEKTGKSGSHIHARLSLLQLVPAVARGAHPGAHHLQPRHASSLSTARE